MPSASRLSAAGWRSWQFAAACGVVCLLVAVLVWITPKTPATSSRTTNRAPSTAGPRSAAPALAATADTENSAPTLPADALNRALKTTDAPHRARRFKRLGASLANDLDVAFHTLASLDSRADRRAFIRGIFSALAQGDPARALQYVRQIGGDVDREAALVALLHRWRGAGNGSSQARQQNIAQFGLEAGLGMELLGGSSPRPDLAVLWTRLVTDAKGKMTMLGEIAATQMAGNPGLAKSYGDGLSRSDSLTFHNALAYAWARNDPGLAWRWASALGDPTTRALTQKVVIGNWMEQDPTRAAQAAAELPFSTPFRGLLLRQAATGYALQNTEGAEAWARTLPAADAEVALTAIQSATSAGVGLYLLSDHSGYPAVSTILGNTAASVSEQIQPGDHIVGIGQEGGEFVNVQQMDLFKVNRLIQGKPGSAVQLQVAPLLAGGGFAQPRIVSLVRQ